MFIPSQRWIHTLYTGSMEYYYWTSREVQEMPNIFKENNGWFYYSEGSPNGSYGKDSACNAGDQDSVAGLGRSPGEGNGNPLQYSCLENGTDREVWWIQSTGSQRVRHNWASKTHTYIIQKQVSPKPLNKSIFSCYEYQQYSLGQ